MASSNFKPLLTANQPGGSPIVDRNLQALKTALDDLASKVEALTALVAKQAQEIADLEQRVP